MTNIHRRDFLRLAAMPVGLTALGCQAAKTAGYTPNLDTRDAWIEIDLARIAWNLRQVRERVAPCPVMAVIKASAYGHGLVAIGRALEQEGTRFLAVGTCSEALRLREAGVRTPILNFGPFTPPEARALVRHGVSQSVYTGDIRVLSEAAQELGTTAKVHVKVDTGLGRVGVRWDEAPRFVEEVAATRGVEIEGTFTPFTEDDEYDRVQLRRLLAVCEGASKKGIDVGIRHAASSAGVLSFPEACLDMVRPGIVIYGQYPSTQEAEARRIDLRPVMSLKTRVVYVKTLPRGDSVSYHRAFVADRPTRVATLSIGYSDGYPHQAAAKAQVLIRGRRHPTIGLVTSNHMTVDVTGADEVVIGDEVVLFGKQDAASISAEELATWAGTSVYKILIGMNPLLPRHYET